MCRIPHLTPCTCSQPLSTRILKRARFPFDATFQNLDLVWEDQQFLDMIYREHGELAMKGDKKSENAEDACLTD